MSEERGHSSSLAAADRREEGDFVAGVELRTPGGKFLIAGSHHGRAIFGELGNAPGIKSKELLDGESIRKVQGFLGLADDIFQAAKKQHLHADGLSDRRHRRIVARAGASSQPE